MRQCVWCGCAEGTGAARSVARIPTAPRDHACTHTHTHSDEGSNILILARTDARQAQSLEEALWRAAAFADAGADLLFIDAL
jgi:2-methylisocitrate lyase-like PEP mutase family enzyme